MFLQAFHYLFCHFNIDADKYGASSVIPKCKETLILACRFCYDFLSAGKKNNVIPIQTNVVRFLRLRKIVIIKKPDFQFYFIT